MGRESNAVALNLVSNPKVVSASEISQTGLERDDQSRGKLDGNALEE